MKNRRAVGLLNPMRDKKLKARTGGEKGTTPVTTTCPEAEKYNCENKKKKMGAPDSKNFLVSYHEELFYGDPLLAGAIIIKKGGPKKALMFVDKRLIQASFVGRSYHLYRASIKHSRNVRELV